MVASGGSVGSDVLIFRGRPGVGRRCWWRLLWCLFADLFAGWFMGLQRSLARTSLDANVRGYQAEVRNNINVLSA
uniref:Uncharacterized protein n=1 Tax=Burkholderia sp. (strain CCGE1003) TaxID=640512 RepID=E1TAV4_BURSG